MKDRSLLMRRFGEMFLLYNIVGWSLVELGLADEFVELIKILDMVLVMLGIL
jgi:hypothetical protein